MSGPSQLGLRAAVDLGRYYARQRRRARRWARAYRRYLHGQAACPWPMVLQVAVTERCNLRCSYCDQWGEHGYHLNKARPVGVMDPGDLDRFLTAYLQTQPDPLVNVYGGEPFMHPAIDEILEVLKRHEVDLLITTNGTRLAAEVTRLVQLHPHAAYMLSFDGSFETTDRVRGTGVSAAVAEGFGLLREASLERWGVGPKLMLNFTISEHTAHAVDEIDEVAIQLGAAVVNYGFRTWVPREAGERYDEQLRSRWGVEPTGAWRSECLEAASFARAPGLEAAMRRIHEKTRRSRFQLRPPWFSSVPTALTADQAATWFADYGDTFGIDRCVMPAYWARVQSSGELFHCLGHPDVSGGNVFEQPFGEIFEGPLCRSFRGALQEDLLGVCARCCGLYITKDVTSHLGGRFFPSAGAAGPSGPHRGRSLPVLGP